MVIRFEVADGGREERTAARVDERDVRMLKALVQEGTKTTAIARKLKRTLSATYQEARKRGVSLGVR
jgi:hypothetical protein